jgi:hypothetical protein
MATVRLQLRRGTAADWASVNPVLAAGEMGVETDTRKVKVGDGATSWSGLDYIASDSPAISEIAQDAINEALVAGTGITKSYDDAGNTITVSVDTTTIATQSYVDQATANIVTLDANQTLTAKTLTSPSLTGTPIAPTAAAGTDTTQLATTAFVQDAIELVVGAAPGALNTLAEIAASLNDDADLSGTLTNSISEKVSKSGDTMSGVLNMNTSKITSLGTATTDFDAANKLYVDQRTANAVGSHKDTTTNIHGIADTANLVVTTDERLSDTRTPSDNSVGTDKIQANAVTTEKITDLNITTAKFNDLSVTTAKIQDLNVTTAKIQDLNVTTDKIADSAITSVKIADLEVTTTKIANENITTVKIASDAITTEKIANEGITTAKIADLNITTAKIADLNITEGKINTSAVTADKIGALAVTEGKIADSAVTTVKIADNAITTGKISAGTIIDSDINNAAEIATSKISGLDTALNAKLDSATAASTYAPIESPTFTGTVSGVTKGHVGLGDVDNTSDVNKPVSTAQASAIATAKSEAIADATSQVNAVIASAPAALDTLDELAAALGDDANFATTVTNSLSTKAPLASPTFTGTVTVAADGIAFSDKTQTKAGVASITTIATEVSSSTTLDALGTDAAVRDSLVPLSGAVNISFEATGDAKYSIGSSISFYQSSGTGANITGNGVTILATPGATLRALSSSVTATKVAATTWLLAGDLKS